MATLNSSKFMPYTAEFFNRGMSTKYEIISLSSDEIEDLAREIQEEVIVTPELCRLVASKLSSYLGQEISERWNDLLLDFIKEAYYELHST